MDGTSGARARRVRERVACAAEYTLLCGNRVVLYEATGKAAMEYDRKGEGYK